MTFPTPPRPRKYRAGETLTFEAAISRINAHGYIMLGNRPIHPAMSGNWSLHTLRRLCGQERIRAAVLTDAPINNEAP